MENQYIDNNPIKNLFDILPKKIEKKEKPLNERQGILKQFVEEINKERIGTKFKPITGRAVAMKTSHIPTKDLYYLLSICKDGKNRNGSFGKVFFGSIKVK